MIIKGLFHLTKEFLFLRDQGLQVSNAMALMYGPVMSFHLGRIFEIRYLQGSIFQCVAYHTGIAILEVSLLENTILHGMMDPHQETHCFKNYMFVGYNLAHLIQ